MEHSFVQENILKMGQVTVEQMKATLLGEYLHFRFVVPEKVTKEFLAEKLADYLEKVQYKTNKKFEDLIKIYVNELNSIVEPYIAKMPPAKKNGPVPVTPRSRRYYDRTAELRKTMKSLPGLVDYTRIILCLYAAIIKSGWEQIHNFDFSLNCLEPEMILTALKNEKTSALFGKKDTKARFDTADPYTTDSCFFVLVIIMLYAIIGDSLEEESDNE